MAWKESCAMDERLGFIVDCIRGETSMSELCERYGATIDYRLRAEGEAQRNEFFVDMRRRALIGTDARLQINP